MMRYETLFLAVPEITNDEASVLEKQLDELIRKSKGSLVSFERWGKYRLAYPVANNEYGVYFLARFETDAEHQDELLSEIRPFLSIKKGDLVKRHIVSRLDVNQPLTYQRPESLDETPRDVDDFLRENKMEGLMGKPSQSRGERPARGSRVERHAVSSRNQEPDESESSDE